MPGRRERGVRAAPIFCVGATLAVVPGPRHACRGGLPQGQPLRGDSRVECRMVKRPQDNQTEGRRQAHRPTMSAAPRFHCHEKDARRDTPPGVSGPPLYALPRGDTPGWPLLPLRGNSPPGGPKGRETAPSGACGEQPPKAALGERRNSGGNLKVRTNVQTCS